LNRAESLSVGHSVTLAWATHGVEMPGGIAAVRVLCIRQNEQLHARSGVSWGRCASRSRTWMLPQWQPLDSSKLFVVVTALRLVASRSFVNASFSSAKQGTQRTRWRLCSDHSQS